MKAIEFENFKINQQKDDEILVSTSFKILNDDDYPIKNSILTSKILENKEVQLKTNNKGFTSLSFCVNKKKHQTKAEVDLLQFYTQQSINSHLVLKEKLPEDKELLYYLLMMPSGEKKFKTHMT